MLNKIKDRTEANNLAKQALKQELAMELSPKSKSKLAEKKKARRKQNIKKVAIGAFIILIIYAGYILFKPFKQGMTYGICKVFIQLYVPFPYTIHYSEVIDKGSSIRIWFSHMDAYGDYQLQRMDCFYEADPETGFAKMGRATIDRREINPDIIRKFNKSLSVIMAYPPDLIYPDPLPRSLNDLQFDFNAYRMQIL